MVTPPIVHVCIGYPVVSSLTPQIVRSHLGVCYSDAGYFRWMSCISDVVSFLEEIAMFHSKIHV